MKPRFSPRVWGVFALAFCVGMPALRAASAVSATAGGMQQSFTGDNVKATFFIPGDALPRFGFVPIRIATDNQQARDLRWHAAFDLNSAPNHGAPMAVHVTTTLNVPASRTGERWVFLPTPEAGATGMPAGYYSGGWSNLTAIVDGSGISGARLNFNTSGRSNNPMAAWAVSAGLESSVRSHLVSLKTDPTPPRPPPGYRGRMPTPPGPQPLLRGGPNLFVFDSSQSLGDWRVWSPFARVLLQADEYAAMPGGNRAALRNWVALGGMLYLAPSAPGAPDAQRVGAGAIITLARPISGTGAHDSEGLFTAATIFNNSRAIPNEISLQKGGLADKVPPAKRAGDWLVYFFVGFAVLVAPVNLFAIAPVKRRHWLFLSVPLISLLAVGVLMAAIYLQDGVGGDGARRAVVVLLPGDNQAAVFQEQISRTGLLFGTSFPLADDTVCAAAQADDSNVQPGRPLEFHRQDGRASGDWFRGRARQAQHLRRLTPTRARVELVGTAPDGAPIVQSSIGTTLRDFCYLDANQRGWTIAQLPPGTRVTLQRLPGDPGLLGTAMLFGEAGSPHFRDLVVASAGHVAPGRFVALGGESDLAPLPTLSSIRWQESSVLFAGSVEGAPAPGKAAP